MHNCKKSITFLYFGYSNIREQICFFKCSLLVKILDCRCGLRYNLGGTSQPGIIFSNLFYILLLKKKKRKVVIPDL